MTAMKKKKHGHIYFSRADRETQRLAKQLARKCNVPYFAVIRILDNLDASAMWLRGDSISDISTHYAWPPLMTREIIAYWHSQILRSMGPYAPLYGYTDRREL
jgi:hypothetical protein